jgi:hypothetical protein
MATKLIAFRISGELLDQAIDQLGADQIAEKSRELLTKFILSQIPADNSIHELTSTDRNLPESQIDSLQNQINDLYSRINQLEKNQVGIHELSGDRPSIHELNLDEDQEMTANRFKPKSIRQQLLDLMGGNSKDSREKIAARFKRLTAIAPASLEGGASYDAMLKYLTDNPQVLTPKENQ